MLWESHRPDAKGTDTDPTRGIALLTLSVATSLDALAVGVSMALWGVSVWMPSVVIGMVTGTFDVLRASRRPMSLSPAAEPRSRLLGSSARCHRQDRRPHRGDRAGRCRARAAGSTTRPGRDHPAKPARAIRARRCLRRPRRRRRDDRAVCRKGRPGAPAGAVVRPGSRGSQSGRIEPPAGEPLLRFTLDLDRHDRPFADTVAHSNSVGRSDVDAWPSARSADRDARGPDAAR